MSPYAQLPTSLLGAAALWLKKCVANWRSGKEKKTSWQFGNLANSGISRVFQFSNLANDLGNLASANNFLTKIICVNLRHLRIRRAVVSSW